MATYLIQFGFIQKVVEYQGVSGTGRSCTTDGPQPGGGEVKAIYEFMGSEFDTMFIIAAPNDQKVGEMVLASPHAATSAPGPIASSSEDEFRSIISSLP